MSIRRLFGIAGVALDESYRAQLWAKRFERGMILIALWLCIRWYLGAIGLLSYSWITFTNWLVWFYFVAEFLVCISLVKHKKHYVIHNWMNWAIIVLGFPVIWTYAPYVAVIRVVRFVLLLRFSLPFWTTAIELLSRKRLGYTLLISLLVTIASGIIISIIDPRFTTIGSGIWYAWQTVTTVGYGDIVPQSTAGRVFGSVLILMGIGLISLLTANFSAFIIGKDEDERSDKQRREIISKLDQLGQQLSQVNQRIEQLENDSSN